VSAFFPVEVSFVTQDGFVRIKVGKADGDVQVVFSVDSVVMAEMCLVVRIVYYIRCDLEPLSRLGFQLTQFTKTKYKY
jgi:hypothetical protein